jgi:putative membrane protein
MKTIIKHFIIYTATLYLLSLVVRGMEFSNGATTMIVTGAVLTLTGMLVRPLINLLLLPINLVTFGLFKWASFAITLYLVTLLVSGFKITNFVYPGFSAYWFSIPEITLTGLFAFLAFSFIISFVSSTIYSIFK